MRLSLRALILTALLAITLPLTGCVAEADGWVRLDVEAFAEEVEATENGFLLDVRTQDEWEADGHLENATLIPHSSLDARSDELPEDKETPILLYCRSGNRSQAAAQTLLDLGYTDIRELESGINGWKDSGRPVLYGP
jgi:phage shock protein E